MKEQSAVRSFVALDHFSTKGRRRLPALRTAALRPRGETDDGLLVTAFVWHEQGPRTTGGVLMLDWDDLRYFLAITRHGSLSAAAKELRVAQSTTGRRLASLEAGLGVRLLDRTPDGYVVTPAGEAVRERAERLEAEARSLERDVGGRDTRLSGLVRITCAETVASHVLARCCAALHQQHPDIAIELSPDPRDLSLAMREAEISVRLTRPEQHDLLVRRIGTLAFGLYASSHYLEQYGEPDFARGCPGHHLIAQVDDIENSDQIGWLANLAPRAGIAFRTSSHEAALTAAVHGGGLACLARFRAEKHDGLTRLAVPSPVPSAAIWLVVHKDSSRTARIKAVLTHIAEGVRDLADTLAPPGTEPSADRTASVLRRRAIEE